MAVFEDNIRCLYGLKGEEWLQELPSLVDSLAQQWDLIELKSLSPLTYHYVLAGLENKNPIILKCGLDLEVLEREANALMAFQGIGCVKLLNFDQSRGALLLERAIPGETLEKYFLNQEDKAIRITSALIKNFQQNVKVSSQFPALNSWLSILNKDFDFPEGILDKARHFSQDLLATSSRQTLLHGDLHHDNVLSNDQGWVAIDPKGIVGDPAYEVGAFIRNPISKLLVSHRLEERLLERVRLFSQLLKLPQERILKWSYVQAVLAACWAVEDNLDPRDWLAIANVLMAVIEK